MNTDWIFMIGLMATIFTKKGYATISCSKCQSSKNPGCEIQPPPPTTCVASGSGITQSCSIVRIYNKDTGMLDQFIRSCSNSQITKCFDSSPGYETCAYICHTDGCNSVPGLHVAKLWLLFLSVFFISLCVRVLSLD